ncbi:MAG: phosphoadenosine phosphosulfate reductase family protein, partial [Marinicaulis sp.]|nr:phosphoadenosine phosphosulfate reductase family protein [Marinicaulis sp.]
MADSSTIENSAVLTANQLAGTNAYYETITAEEILLDALAQPWFSQPAVVSSFGAEAVVLLSMIARVKPDIPVIFIDTGKLFGETLRYRDRLQHVL